MNKDEAGDLLRRYANNDCTPEEKILVERWYLQESGCEDSDDLQNNFSARESEIWKGTLKKAGLPPGRSRLRFIGSLASAAAILLFIGFGVYFFSLKDKVPETSSEIAKTTDVKPGGNKALLILADGSEIILDDSRNGTLVNQGNVVISKSADGHLVYDASRAVSENDRETAFNTISTPRGGQYQVVLPDGSKVWLNSASSIYFPTAFNGSERNVTITGEAYFEVVKNQGKAFSVLANGITVKVLGTHFNVMAYSDESSLKTTLLEGSVRVVSGRSATLIKPGQEAEVTNGNISVGSADTEEAMAWKNGYFYFKNTDIRSVMRQLSRWYDVDVEYKGAIPETVFSGKMYRNVNASKLLDILSYFKVNFRVEESSSPAGKPKIVIL